MGDEIGRRTALALALVALAACETADVGAHRPWAPKSQRMRFGEIWMLYAASATPR